MVPLHFGSMYRNLNESKSCRASVSVAAWSHVAAGSRNCCRMFGEEVHPFGKLGRYIRTPHSLRVCGHHRQLQLRLSGRLGKGESQA